MIRKALIALGAIFAWGLLSGEAMAAGGEIGKDLGLYWIIPFAGILLSIALLPLFAAHFWHKNYGKIAAFWAIAFAVPFLIAHKGAAWHAIVHIYLIDYIPFVVLLLSLFTVAGGIVVKGSFRGVPTTNSALILVGALLASWVGTTGASMLMIRPILKANKNRVHKTHTIVFFIFLVSNVGGALTPLGDPPLFLGFIHSVPFFWTLALLPQMVFVLVALLAIYYVLDTVLLKKEGGYIEDTSPDAKQPFGLLGKHNFLYLAVIVAAVLMSGSVPMGEVTILGTHVQVANLVRDIILLLVTVLAFKTTRRELRESNQFSWEPIVEVAKLFAGIFMTIVPALLILGAGQEGALGFLITNVKESWQYFWVTGILSSFLDNAPTYFIFFNSALANFQSGLPEPEAVKGLIENQEIYLKAISCGAVFMGAVTYIGNAPNFMVRSIAEEGGVAMPSFFGYMLKYSVVYLIPIFILVTLIFF